MMGCRYGAKNTLDQNYLYLAEKRGAQVFAETNVVDVRPLQRLCRRQRRLRGLHRQLHRSGCALAIAASPAAAWSSQPPSLGTMDLLFHLETERLAACHQRPNSAIACAPTRESLIGVRVPGTREDLSKGVAIGSGIYIDDHTHIEAVRYPAGSDSMGPAGHHAHRRPSWPKSRLHLAKKYGRRSRHSSLENHPGTPTLRLGPRICHPPLHAGS